MNIFGSVGIPHGFCYLWDPGLLWLHVSSDLLIALSYFLIPFGIFRIVRMRGDVPYNWVLICFEAFIVACGITHVMEVVTLWHPVYWVSGGLKALTAVISLATFCILIKMTPAIVAIPSGEALARAHRQLASVMESTSVCMYALNQDWTISYMNGKAAQLLGPFGDVIGKRVWEAFPNQNEATRTRLKTVMETRVAMEFESYYEPLDLWSWVSVSPWETGGVTVFFNDISREKRLQRELDRETAMREQRLASLAQMAAGLAHEISNPLGIIHARACDLMETFAEGEIPTSEEVRTRCESIVKTSDRAIRILRGLRMFAREGAQDPMVRAGVPPMIEATVALVQQRFHTHGIQLDVAIEPGIADISCRETQIAQVVLNLLNNAFDAIDGTAGSERWVKLRARTVVQAVDAADALAQGRKVVIEVIDGGPGVSLENRPFLMQPFFTTKPVGAGMGIGLSLSRGIARDHGGELALMDLDGHTCFCLTLPALAPVIPIDAQQEGTSV